MDTHVQYHSDRIVFVPTGRAIRSEFSGVLVLLMISGIAVKGASNNVHAAPFAAAAIVGLLVQICRAAKRYRGPVFTIWLEPAEHHSESEISAENIVLVEVADSKWRGISRGNSSPSDWRMAQLYLHTLGEAVPRLVYERYWNDREQVVTHALRLGGQLGVAVEVLGARHHAGGSHDS